MKNDPACKDIIKISYFLSAILFMVLLYIPLVAVGIQFNLCSSQNFTIHMLLNKFEFYLVSEPRIKIFL